MNMHVGSKPNVVESDPESDDQESPFEEGCADDDGERDEESSLGHASIDIDFEPLHLESEYTCGADV